MISDVMDKRTVLPLFFLVPKCPAAGASSSAGYSAPRASSSAVPFEVIHRHNCGVGYEEYRKGKRVGLGIAGNAGRFGGDCVRAIHSSRSPDDDKCCADNRYAMAKIHHHHKTQEESTVSNIHVACLKKRSGYLLEKVHNGLKLKLSWGLIHPSYTDHKTFQQVDYTVGDGFKFKYGKAVSLETYACYQDFGREWDTNKIFECVAVFTAGPNVAAKGRDATSTMTRTRDPAALDKTYFENAIKAALEATLEEMKRRKVAVAILPALSQGLYKGHHMVNFRSLVLECLGSMRDMGSIEKVIVCT